MECSRFYIGYDAARRRIYGNTGQWCDWRSFMSDLRNGCFGRVDDLCEETLVILDDVGASHDPNDFAASVLDRILNARLGKWTMITTNYSLGAVSLNFDDRIASRMIRDGNVFVESEATDYALNTR